MSLLLLFVLCVKFSSKITMLCKFLFWPLLYCNCIPSPMLLFVVWKTQVICAKVHARVHIACVRPEFESSLSTCSCSEFLNRHKATAVCLCISLCVCVRSPGAPSCVKYNCCVRKWKVSNCQSGGTRWNHVVCSLREKLSLTDTGQWQVPLFKTWRCRLRYSRVQLKRTTVLYPS